MSAIVTPAALATKILIGGQALAQLGSSRSTEDVDYLINDVTTKAMFLHDPELNQDYINANGHKFFARMFRLEQGQAIARPQALLELKSFALVQHCLNRNFRKADEAEYDIKFLSREFGLTRVQEVNQFVTTGQLSEVQKIINKVQAQAR